MIAPRHYEWPFVCVCCTASLLLLLPPSPFVSVGDGCRSERRGNQRLQPMRKQRERERARSFGEEVCRGGLAILCVCLSARTIVDGLVPVGYWNGRQEKFVRYECRDRWKVDSPTMGEFE